MKSKYRQNRILRILKSASPQTTAQLRETLGVSGETVRQDLVSLEKQGLIEREHGSVFLAGKERLRTEFRKRGLLSLEQRRKEILALLEKAGSIRTRELVNLFNVSVGTIRNDLNDLADAGKVERRHGEVVLVTEKPTTAIVERLIGRRPSVTEKAVGERILTLFSFGDLIYLDDSVVSLHVAERISADTGVTVLTNSLRVAMILSERRVPCDSFMLPGFVSRTGFCTDVHFRESIASTFHVTKAFFGISSCTEGGGFYVESKPQSDLYHFILDISDSVYLHVDGDRVGVRGKYVFVLDRHRHKVIELIVGDGSDGKQLVPNGMREWPVVVCGRSGSYFTTNETTYAVGFTMLDGSHYFSRAIRDHLQTALSRIGNLDLVVLDNEGSRETTMRNVDRLIDAGVDLVIEYQHDSDLSGVIGEKFSHAGISVIAVDVPVTGAVYFGANNYRAGIIGGEAMTNEVRNRWGCAPDRILVVGDASAGSIPEGRISGMIDSFRSEFRVDDEKITRIDPPYDEDEIRVAVRNELQVYGDGERIVIFSINSIAAAGILSAVRETCLASTTLLVTHNLSPELERELETSDSPLVGCVTFHPEQYGERIAQLVFSMLRGHPVDPNNYTEHHLVGRKASSG